MGGLTGLFLSNKLVTRVLHNALNADKTDAGDAEVAHELFGVSRTEIRVLHHFLMLVREFQRKVVFRQLLGLEWFL